MTFSRIISIFRTAGNFYGPHKRRLILLGIVGVINGILGAASIGAMIPLLSFLLKKESVAEPDLITRMVGWLFTYAHLGMNIYYILALVLILFFLKAATLFVFKYLGAQLVYTFERDLRKDLYACTLASSWSYLSRQKVGFLENTLMVDTHKAVDMLALTISLTQNITSLIMYLVVAISVSSSTTFYLLGMGAAIFLFTRPLLTYVRKFSSMHAAYNKKIAHEINENMLGLKVIKSMAIEREIHKAGSLLFENIKSVLLRATVLKTAANVVLQPVSILFVGIIFVISYGRPGFDAAVFLTTLYLLQQLFEFVERIQSSFNDMNVVYPFARNFISSKKIVL